MSELNEWFGYNLDSEGFIQQRTLEDSRRMGVDPMAYGARLGISAFPPAHDTGTWDDQWDFPSITAALQALNTWNPVEEKEPEGWHRHHRTGRYRPDGNKKLEYVRNDGTVEDQVRIAVIVTQGWNRLIQDIHEISVEMEGALPTGTRCFKVRSESSECEHKPKCQWYDTVYHYLDRSVVLSESDMFRTSLATLKKRLLEGKE